MTVEEAEAQAVTHQENLTKPLGSLGELEKLAIQLAGIQRTALPFARPAAVAIFAADHPVVAECPEISAYPQGVTAAMVENFKAGGAAACVLAQQHDVAFSIHDVGVVGGNSEFSGGAGDLRCGEAMTEALFDKAITAGETVVSDLLAADSGLRVFIPGEMGIGNTTAAAAVVGAHLDLDADSVTGSGTGLTFEKRKVKVEAVQAALENADRSSPESIIRTVGGRDIAALFGAIRSAARNECVVLIDGFIVSSAALAVCRAHPELRGSMIFAHRSRESGHRLVLDSLSARPLLDLNLALGEASGALLAFPLLESACKLHCEMATFESAGVSRATV